MSTKKNLIKFLAICFVSFVSVNSLMAQLKMSAEFRPRAELRHGYKSLDTDADKSAFSITQRMRLNVGYTMDKLKFGVSLQDVRVWGDVPQQNTTSSATNQLMLHTGWAEHSFTNAISVKIGRQELNYDDARILGNADWAQQARAHDLVLFKYEKDFKLHIGAAFNQDAEKMKGTDYALADLTKNYKTMQFAWFNKKVNDLNVSVLILNNGMQNKSTDATPVYKIAYSQTVGTRLVYDKGANSVAGAFYSTMGKDITLRKMSAYYASLAITNKINDNWGAGLGWELLSGTSQVDKKNDPSNYTNKSFSPLYGTNHKFNGAMDYFYVGNHANSVGLNDLYASITYKKGKFNAGITPHYFQAASDVIDPSVAGGTMAKGLGTEIDLYAGYKLSDNTQVSGGYSQMFGTKTLQQLNGGGDYKATNNWAWLMITFKPEFLK